MSVVWCLVNDQRSDVNEKHRLTVGHAHFQTDNKCRTGLVRFSLFINEPVPLNSDGLKINV